MHHPSKCRCKCECDRGEAYRDNFKKNADDDFLAFLVSKWINDPCSDINPKDFRNVMGVGWKTVVDLYDLAGESEKLKQIIEANEWYVNEGLRKAFKERHPDFRK